MVFEVYQLTILGASTNPPSSIPVNPPSFVRSLRHFGIAENLRPGDENLRHLRVTPRFKKMRIIFAIKSENARSQTRPTFHTMMTRTRNPDVSETDVSSNKMKIQKNKTGSPEVTRVAVMPSQNVSTFQKRWVAVGLLQGEQSISSTKSCRPTHGCHTVS